MQIQASMCTALTVMYQSSPSLPSAVAPAPQSDPLPPGDNDVIITSSEIDEEGGSVEPPVVIINDEEEEEEERQELYGEDFEIIGAFSGM